MLEDKERSTLYSMIVFSTYNTQVLELNPRRYFSLCGDVGLLMQNTLETWKGFMRKL